MTKKVEKAEKTAKLTHQEANDRRATRAPEWAGLEDVADGDAMRAFVDGVESAFLALHQSGVTLDEEEDQGGDATIGAPWIVEWAQTVEDRFEFMGIQRRATNMPSKPPIVSGGSSGIEAAGLKIWTKSVWARFAALGQVLSEV